MGHGASLTWAFVGLSGTTHETLFRMGLSCEHRGLDGVRDVLLGHRMVGLAMTCSDVPVLVPPDTLTVRTVRQGKAFAIKSGALWVATFHAYPLDTHRY